MQHLNWKREQALSQLTDNPVAANFVGRRAFSENFIKQRILQQTGKGVKGLIMDGDKVLILEKPDRKPDLPGGRAEPGEGLLEALSREIDEETGCQAKVLGPVVEWSFWKNPYLAIKGITFFCQYLGGKVHLSDEHSGYNWIRIKEIMKMDWERPYFG